MTKLYVLAGYDEAGSFNERISYWKKRAHDVGDVEIIYPSGPTESMAHLASRIKPPANILLECHGGGDGNFTWGKEQYSPFYHELFKELPRQGIVSVTVEGCCGESAMFMMQGLPKGTLLQARVSAKISGVGGSVGGEIAKEITSYKEITPLSIILEELDGTVPSHYIDWGYTNNPNNVLPHTIGIGGHPPLTLDLNQKVAELAARGKSGKLDVAKLQQAVGQVKQHFDVVDDSANIFKETFLFAGDQQKLNRLIDDVAQKLAKGADTRKFSLDEKRVAYGITIANLYGTGEMAQLTQQQNPTAPKIGGAANGGHQPVKWGGQGNEQIAKLQAIAELVFHRATDRGGADDNRVDGINGGLTNPAIEQLEVRYGVNTQAALLNKLVHDQQVIRVFGGKIINGEQVADINLQQLPHKHHHRPHHNFP